MEQIVLHNKIASDAFDCLNLHKKVDSKYSSGTPWSRSTEVEKVSHD